MVVSNRKTFKSFHVGLLLVYLLDASNGNELTQLSHQPLSPGSCKISMSEDDLNTKRDTLEVVSGIRGGVKKTLEPSTLRLDELSAQLETSLQTRKYVFDRAEKVLEKAEKRLDQTEKALEKKARLVEQRLKAAEKRKEQADKALEQKSRLVEQRLQAAEKRKKQIEKALEQKSRLEKQGQQTVSASPMKKAQQKVSPTKGERLQPSSLSQKPQQKISTQAQASERVKRTQSTSTTTQKPHLKVSALATAPKKLHQMQSPSPALKSQPKVSQPTKASKQEERKQPSPSLKNSQEKISSPAKDSKHAKQMQSQPKVSPVKVPKHVKQNQPSPSLKKPLPPSPKASKGMERMKPTAPSQKPQQKVSPTAKTPKPIKEQAHQSSPLQNQTPRKEVSAAASAYTDIDMVTIDGTSTAARIRMPKKKLQQNHPSLSGLNNSLIKRKTSSISETSSVGLKKKTQGRRLRPFLHLVTLDVAAIGFVVSQAFFKSQEAGGLDLVEKTFYAMAMVCILTTTFSNLDIFSFMWANKASMAANDTQMVAFGKFQKNYLTVQLLATFITFSQSAYLYKIYESHGYEMKDTATLYLSGFLTSLLISPFVGRLIDSHGRKKGVLCQLILNVIQCQLLRFKDFRLLLLGRIISGFSFALTTSYECWMVSQHNSGNFSPHLLMDTFSKGALVLAGTAVMSGVVSGALVERGLGLIAPVNLASGASLVCLLLVLFTWRENYGRATPGTLQQKPSAFQGIQAMFRDPRIFFLGITQCMNEVAVMIFGFMWTPLLLHLTQGSELNVGLVYATFMISLMIGSSVPKIVRAFPLKVSPEKMLMCSLAIGTISLASITVQKTLAGALCALILYEMVFGSFIPTLGSMKARIIPEHIRATMTNTFKVLTNTIIIALLLGPLGSSTWTMQKKQKVVFTIGASALSIGLLSQVICYKLQQ